MNTPLTARKSTTFRHALCAVLVAAGIAATPMLAQDPSAQAQPAPTPHAQWQGGPHGRGDMYMHHMAKALNLTEDQKTQIKAIQEGGRQQMMALHEDTSTPKEAKREKMMAFHQEQEAKIKAVLTAEQLTKYEAMQQKMKERRAAHQASAPTTPAA